MDYRNSESVRSGKIELTYGNAEPTNVTVRQQAFENAVIKISSSSLTVDAWGGNGKITYSITNPRPGAKVTARSESSWLKNIVVGASLNSNSSSRSGSIVLEYEDAEPVTVTVTQNALSGTITSLGVSESANCYIVTKPGVYRMPAVKGNDKSQKVSAASVEVLWETRSDANVRVGDIVNLTGYDNDNIYFNVKGKTSSTVPEGNALIAAKDASGEILWSWHIWVTSVMPEDQVYKNGAGTMMECDLGAACVESDAYPWSSGLHYQYGRKDPFWGDRSCTLNKWETVKKNSMTGTESYAAAHPTTFITAISYSNGHWLNNGDTRLWWRSKSISDPCPPGYVRPDGGQYGVWVMASGNPNGVRGEDCSSYLVDNGSGAALEFRSAGKCYYRPKGYIDGISGALSAKELPVYSYYWSGTSTSDGLVYIYEIEIYNSSFKYDARPYSRTKMLSSGYFVRCMKKTW